MTPMGPAIRKESEADSIKQGYLCNQNAEPRLEGDQKPQLSPNGRKNLPKLRRFFQSGPLDT